LNGIRCFDVNLIIMNTAFTALFLSLAFATGLSAQQRNDFKDRFQYAFGGSMEVVPIETTPQSTIRFDNLTQLRYAV